MEATTTTQPVHEGATCTCGRGVLVADRRTTESDRRRYGQHLGTTFRCSICRLISWGPNRW